MKSLYPLGFFPTPLHKMHRLSAVYKPYELYIKRDDNTGLASGGNKTRKLQHLIKEAIEQGCDTVITMGAQQSNHCRQTAAACAVAGLECHLLVVGNAPDYPDGNLLLSVILGAKIHYCGKQITDNHSIQLIKDIELYGKKPYLIPYGGSSLTGTMGFVDAAEELKQQMDNLKLEFDYIFFASCSGGTQAGLMLGKEKFNIGAKLMPVSIQKTELNDTPLEMLVLEIIDQGLMALDIDKVFVFEDCALIRGYDDAGYGVVTEQEKSAIHELAQTEGILLDPVYTARAFFAMTDYLKNGLIEPGSKVLFWHTGGLPANFHYSRSII